MTAFKKPAVVINANAGSTTDITAEITQIFKARFGVTPACHYVEGGALVPSLNSAIDSGADLIVTYGGDGTSLAGVSIANAVNVPVVPLPGGTMNMLPKSLYGSDDWKTALTIALSQDGPVWIPVGLLNDRIFIVAALVGTIVRLGVTRELVREGSLVEATKTLAETLRDVSPEGGFEYHLGHNAAAQPANMLQITCPFMNDFAADPNAFDVLGINIESYTELPTLGLTAIIDQWREDNAATSNTASTVEITGSGEVDILLDGEHEIMRYPLKVSFKEKGALFLCPKRK